MKIKASKSVMAAKFEHSEQFDNELDLISADWDYFVDGCLKLARDGKEGENSALQTLYAMHKQVNAAIEEVNGNMNKGE